MSGCVHGSTTHGAAFRLALDGRTHYCTCRDQQHRVTWALIIIIILQPYLDWPCNLIVEGVFTHCANPVAVMPVCRQLCINGRGQWHPPHTSLCTSCTSTCRARSKSELRSQDMSLGCPEGTSAVHQGHIPSNQLEEPANIQRFLAHPSSASHPVHITPFLANPVAPAAVTSTSANLTRGWQFDNVVSRPVGLGGRSQHVNVTPHEPWWMSTCLVECPTPATMVANKGVPATFVPCMTCYMHPQRLLA
jgi:hypothetical protein